MKGMTRSILLELAETANSRKVPADFAIIRPSLLVSRPIPHIGAHSWGAADILSEINSVIVYVFLSERAFDYYVRDNFTSVFLERLRAERPKCRSIYDDYLILRKEAAALAGIGVIGRNALFFSHQFGFHCKIDLVLSEIEFDEYDGPPGHPGNAEGLPPEDFRMSQCNDCALCVESCPLGCPMDFALREWKRCDRFISPKISEPEKMCNACVAACPYSGSMRGPTTEIASRPYCPAS